MFCNPGVACSSVLRAFAAEPPVLLVAFGYVEPPAAPFAAEYEAVELTAFLDREIGDFIRRVFTGSPKAIGERLDIL